MNIRKILTNLAVASVAVMVTGGTMLQAQQARFPLPSPNAKVTQTIGITDVTVTYSRPGVKGREVWGKLVPFNELWRSGANAATILEISDDVKIEGQKLPAGKYSFFTIPTATEWTVVINKNPNLGGTAGYKQEEDALRVKVKPVMTADKEEWLEYEFEDLSDNSATLVLKWDKLKVPVKIDADTKDLVLSKARSMVSWIPPMQFANYCLQQNANLDEAMKMIDVSIAVQETYRNHVVKARLLERSGKKADAVKLMEKAVAMGKAQKDAPFDLADSEKMLTEWKAKK